MNLRPPSPPLAPSSAASPQVTLPSSGSLLCGFPSGHPPLLCAPPPPTSRCCPTSCAAASPASPTWGCAAAWCTSTHSVPAPSWSCFATTRSTDAGSRGGCGGDGWGVPSLPRGLGPSLSSSATTRSTDTGDLRQCPWVRVQHIGGDIWVGAQNEKNYLLFPPPQMLPAAGSPGTVAAGPALPQPDPPPFISPLRRSRLMGLLAL